MIFNGNDYAPEEETDLAEIEELKEAEGEWKRQCRIEDEPNN